MKIKLALALLLLPVMIYAQEQLPPAVVIGKNVKEKFLVRHGRDTPLDKRNIAPSTWASQSKGRNIKIRNRTFLIEEAEHPDRN